MTAAPKSPRGPTGVDELAVAVFTGLPPSLQQVLARCAVVTLFDRAMYEAALRAGPEPEIEPLLRRGLLEVLPGGDDAYRVLPAVQEAAWASWFDADPDRSRSVVPPALRAVAEDIARHCASAGRDVELLRALLLIDQERATSWFVEAYGRCDDRLDLAGCHNLLNVLAEPSRHPFVQSELATVGDDRRRYLAAREMWRAAFLSSAPARYLPREELEAALEELLGETGPRVLRLHGSGGYGKSTLLRWFLARRCVPDRIACALVDLDVVDPVNATRHPWLLVLEIAYQLNDQMRGAPFQELLREHGSYRSVLAKQPPVAARAGSAALGTLTGQVDAGEIVPRFLDALHDAAPTRPVVVVLDTFEEAVLRPAGDTAALGQLLRELDEGDPAVRLVVSGRLTAAETDLAVPGWRLPAGAAERVVPPFSRAQSAEYLQSVRRIARPDLVSAIVARAGGLPWQLALWGDVVEQYPTLTPEMLEQVWPEVAWAVDRIVGRINDHALQWLIRYGTAPRRLRRDFAEQIIMPRIARAMAGSPDDRPDLDPRPPESVPVFRTGVPPPSGGSGFSDLWHHLTRYAATTSWMWLAPGDEDAVVFHPELRDPMRRLVAAQPVGDLLHQDAVRYYTDLAARDTSSWSSWTCEAIYHRFQWQGSAAARDWRAAVAEARRRGLAEAIADVAGEILGPEYVDEQGRPRELLSGRPVVDSQTLAAAHTEQAWALSRIALWQRLPGGHPTWSRVESSLSAASALPTDPESGARQRAAQAALFVARGQPTVAVDLLETVLAEDDDMSDASVDRCVALMLLAEALRASGQHERARSALLAAREVAKRLGVREVSARIAVALAKGAAILGRLDEADNGLRRTVEEHPELAHDPDLRRTRARIALDIGRPASALALAFRPEFHSDLALEQAEAQIVLGNPVAAVQSCSALLAGALEPEQHAAILVLRARASAELLDVDQALNDLDRAREVYFQTADIEGAGTCTGLAADVKLHGIGDLREAQQHLDEADRLTLEPGSPAWNKCRLLRAELEVRRGSPSTATRAALEALDPVATPTSDPRLVVDVALAAFCWSRDLERQVIALLSEHLPRISPGSARLTALTALQSCPRWHWGEQLLQLTLPEGLDWDRDVPEDAAWLDLRAAELMRVAGRTERAVQLATAATSALAASAPLASWMWLRAVQRAAPHGADAHATANRPADLNAFPLLAAAHALTLATWQLRAGRISYVTDLLDEAESALASATQRITRWNAQLADLRRDLAEREGRLAAARRLALMATAMRRELGDPAAKADPASADPGQSFSSARQEMTLRAVLDPSGDLVLSAGTARTRLPAAHPLVAGLHEQNRTTGKSPVVRWIREELASGPFLSLDALLPPLDSHEAVDLRISADPPLAQLTWELATLHGRRLADQPGVRSIYRAPDPEVVARMRVRILQEVLAAAGFDPGPIDGLLGPETAGALSAFQRSAGVAADGIAGVETWAALRSTVDGDGGARTVLVVRRDLELELVAQRGYSLGGGIDLEPAYATRGWQVHSANSEELAHRSVTPFPVDLVHVNASMEVTGGVPYLSFGADTTVWSRSRPESLTVTDVDTAIRRLALRGRTPLVILDIVGTPHFGSETVRQLLLRNDFAHQLLALGQCYAVIATGLAPEWRTADVQERLLQAVDAATTAAELAIALRSNIPVGFDPGDLLPEAATALFTAVPPDLMPPLSRSSSRPK